LSDARPSEVTVVHTRILRCMLAVDDCYAYWRKVDTSVPLDQRARVAFERRWFGTKSEARLRTIMTDMVERFDAFPEALALLQRLGSVPAVLRPWICHLHTQLADPIYRRFTGDLLPERRKQGLLAIDRDTVARWVDALEPGRWTASTCIKFGSNLLSAAGEAGLVVGRRDARRIATEAGPDVIVGYALYLLRNVSNAGSLTDNPYLRSIGVGGGRLPARIPGVRVAELGGVVDVTWGYPDLTAWGLETLGAAA